jgi:hypothetical protein
MYKFDLEQNEKNIYIDNIRLILLWSYMKQYPTWEETFDHINLFFEERKSKLLSKENFWKSLFFTDNWEVIYNSEVRNNFINLFIRDANYYAEYIPQFQVSINLVIPIADYVKSREDKKFFRCRQCHSIVKTTDENLKDYPIVCPHCVPLNKETPIPHEWFIVGSEHFKEIDKWLSKVEYSKNHTLYRIFNFFKKNDTKAYF